MDDFWSLNSSIIEVVSQKADKSEILVQVSSPIVTFIEQFEDATSFINYSNSNGFWNMDELSLISFYQPIIDNPILLGEITR